MITEAQLCQINGLVAKFYRPRTTKSERREIYDTLLREHGVLLKNDGANHAG